MKSKVYKRHVYDLELKSILHNYEKEISKVKLDNRKLTTQYFVGLIKSVINEYCKFKGISLYKAGQVVVLPDANHAYDQFLGVSLVFYDDHKIQLYLDYHQQQFENYSRPQETFIDLVEFVIIDIVKWSSPFNNSKRLKIIMAWVNDKRKLLPVLNINQTSVKKATSRPVIDYLKWKKGISTLKSLSAKLQGKYTIRKMDFEDVFNRQKIIVWKSGVESWVYLMYRLTRPPYQCLTTSKGAKPYFKVGEQFFSFQNEVNERKRNYSSMLNNIKTRSKDKHKDTMDKIDMILKSAFPDKPKV